MAKKMIKIYNPNKILSKLNSLKKKRKQLLGVATRRTKTRKPTKKLHTNTRKAPKKQKNKRKLIIRVIKIPKAPPVPKPKVEVIQKHPKSVFQLLGIKGIRTPEKPVIAEKKPEIQKLPKMLIAQAVTEPKVPKLPIKQISKFNTKPPEAPRAPAIAKPNLTESIPKSGEFLETGIDKLLSIIAEKNSVSTDEAAHILNVNKQVIEQWAQILSDHNIISIEYPSIGKTIMTKKELKE